MKVLLIKTSSLGDVIHTLPALTDALRAIPGLKVDWVIEKGFAAIPGWHPAVDKIIPVAIRYWRKNIFKGETWREIRNVISGLRAEKYDLIIDAQGLIKTAWLAWFVKAKTHGYALGCARDKVVPIFYQHQYKITFEHHAITRMRKLFSQALNYTFDDNLPSYGVNKANWQTAKLPCENYILFLHNTTWKNKHWPETYWIKLAALLKEKNYKIKLSWGSEQERINSQKIANQCCHAELLPDLNVEGLLPYIANAKAVVSVDTGLGHLAAALNIPTVALFGPTDPDKTGIMGPRQLSLKSDFSCAPCLSRECRYRGKTAEWPACFESITPALVLKKLMDLLNKKCEEKNA